MTRYVIKGKFWWAGDKIFIETEEEGMNELPTEVCLNDLMKNNIAEESEITIVIDTKRNIK